MNYGLIAEPTNIIMNCLNVAQNYIKINMQILGYKLKQYIIFYRSLNEN